MLAYDFTGEVALVTGGASGVGEAVTARLLELGAECRVWDINSYSGELLDFSNPRLDFAQLDVSIYGEVLSAVDVLLQASHVPSILVNCCGVLGRKSALWELSPEEWFYPLSNNLESCFNACHVVVPMMIKEGYGRIINIASVAGKDGSKNASGYSASKGAIVAMTKSLGKELAGTGVLANVVTPSATDTPLYRAESQESRISQVAKIPLGRAARAMEVAEMVLWLASRSCSFSTGAVFDVSGGRSSY